MVMWRLKKCPRCKGDMFIDRDLYGWYEQCLQCSYRSELKDIVKLGQQTAQRDSGPTEVRTKE